MNILSTGIALFALVFAVISVWYSLRVAKYVQLTNKSSVTLRELTKIQTELTEHADAIAALNKSLSKLRSRISMRQLRAGDNDGEPDSEKDPAAWKAWKREQIHNARFNK